ncbi:MAG TPA: cadherin-like domain-containing protein, partial [Mariprofundaceae bacterium]|nr:cadherin-like domain-containing protein [Mariprofundaceae bacterium]
SSRFGPADSGAPAVDPNARVVVTSSEEDATISTANDVGAGTRFLLEGVLGDSSTATQAPNGAYSGWDFDFFKFKALKAGDTLKITSNQIDFRRESFNVYDSAGNKLLYYNADTAYSLEVPADGDYYLLVTDGYTNPNDPFTSTTTQYGGPSSSFDDSAGPYSINVDVVGGVNADVPFVFKREFLDATTSHDYLAGGNGNDTYVVDGTYVKVPGTPIIDDCGDPVPTESLQWTTDTVVENAGEGFDTVISSASFTMGDNIERLELIYDEASVAAADPQMQADLLTFGMDGTGNAQDNEIIGNILKNHIDGGAGADYMEGGAGDDTYVVDNAGDVVIENAGEGNDTVESSIDYSLEGTNIENLTLSGTAATGRGNTGDNILRGNAADNVLEGLAGNDQFYGGAGNDTMMGGAGNDRYVFRLGDGADVIDDAQGSDTLYVGNDQTTTNIEGERIGNDAVIKLVGTTDSITLTDWFVNAEGVNRIEFCDGTFLDHAGIEGLFNQPPVANADSMTAFEDGGIVITPTAALLANDTDPNPGDILTVESIGVSAIGAAVSLVGNEVHYDIGSRFQELKAGAVVYDSFEYTINDGNGATATSVVNVTIVGTNDGPVANVDFGAAVEDGNVVTLLGTDLMANDTDVD